jgi:hypothetical protein
VNNKGKSENKEEQEFKQALRNYLFSHREARHFGAIKLIGHMTLGKIIFNSSEHVVQAFKSHFRSKEVIFCPGFFSANQ